MRITDVLNNGINVNYTKFMVVVASILSINNALASNDSWSAGVFYSQQSVDDRDFKLANLIVNVPINNFFTIDFRLGTGISGHTDNSLGFSEDSIQFNDEKDLGLQGSVSIKAHYPLFNSVNGYITLGITNTTSVITKNIEYFDSDSDSLKTIRNEKTEDDTSISYGVGIDYRMTNTSVLFIEYQMFQVVESIGHDSPDDWKNINIGFRYVF